MLDPTEPLGAELLGEGHQRVNLTARELAAALSIDTLYLTSVLNYALEYLVLGCTGRLGGVS